MSALHSMARACIAWLASENEREDRLGDLEELLGAVERKAGARAATRRYLREAAAICLSIIQRRIRRSITNGGLDMARIILWAALSVGGVFLFLHLGGGSVFVYMQPFEWGVMLAAMIGFAAAGRRLGAWPGILADLRRAGEVGGHSRLARRAAYLKKPEPSAEFAHLGGVFAIAEQVGPQEADRQIAGGIALFREKGRQRLGVVEQTARDAYAGAAIAGLFGCVHIVENLEEPLMVLGHLFGGALSAVFFGVILGRAVIAPIASQLSALHEQQAREMEALRLSLGDRDRPVPAETFDVLASGLTSYA